MITDPRDPMGAEGGDGGFRPSFRVSWGEQCGKISAPPALGPGKVDAKQDRKLVLLRVAV